MARHLSRLADVSSRRRGRMLLAGQTFRERRPTPAAARHVATVWVQRVAPDAAPYTHRTVPNGGVELSVQVGSPPQVTGPQTAPVVETLAPGTTVAGVRFQLGAAPALLGVPASELVDATVGWDELGTAAAAELGEAVAAAASPDHAADLVERAVLDLIVDAESPDPLATEAARRLMPGRASDVGSLTSSLYISERQLRRRTVAAIGLPPKVVQRILRFQGFLAFAGARELEGADLATLAAETGYADQSHLTRESLRLAGLTPRALLQEAEESCRGVHDHGPSWQPLLAPRGLTPR